MAGPRNAGWSAASSVREVLTAAASEYERVQAENHDLHDTIRLMRANSIQGVNSDPIGTARLDIPRVESIAMLPEFPEEKLAITKVNSAGSGETCEHGGSSVIFELTPETLASKSAWAEKGATHRLPDGIITKSQTHKSLLTHMSSVLSRYSSEYKIHEDPAEALSDSGSGDLSSRPKMRLAIRDSVTPMFPNQGDMKSIVKTHLAAQTKRYRVEHMYKEEGFCQSIARSPWFENATLAVIVLNSIWIAIDTDYNKAEVLIDAHPVFMVFEQAFCFFFTGELLIRFLSFKKKCECFRDSWFVFDLTLVTLMIVESWVMVMFTFVLSFSRSGERKVSNVSILRMAKLLRIMRMLRISRLLRTMPEFFILLKALSAAFRAVFFTLMFLVIILYVFGICFTTVLKGSKVGEAYFYNVPISMQRLFFQVALFDEVINLVLELTEEKEWMALVLLYVLCILGGITIMNMLIGVLCEAVTAVADSERTTLHVARVQTTLQRIMADDIDDDHDGLISKEEFAKMMKSPEAVRLLGDIGVDVVGLVDIADTIFADVTVHGQIQQYDKKLEFVEFMEVLLQLRGSNKATVKDIVELRKELHISCRKIDKLTNNFELFGASLTARNDSAQASSHNKYRSKSIESTTLADTKSHDTV